MPGDAPDEGRRGGDAGGRRDEIMEDQPDHLRKIRQGRFSPVILPIRVGGEARRRVEGQVRRNGPESLRVERQEMLEPEHGVGEQHSGQAENDEGPRVVPPILLRFRVDAEEPIEEALDRPDRPVQPGLAFWLEDPDEVEAQGLRGREQEADEEGQLKPAGKVHCHHLVRTFRAAGRSTEDSR
jgi:hypothetical protein